MRQSFFGKREWARNRVIDMRFSYFLKLVRSGVVLVGVMLTAPAFGQVAEQAVGQTTPLEAGKRPVSISAPPTVASGPKTPFEPNPAYTSSALVERYPVQAITTLELSKQALEDLKIGRKQIETIFKQDEKACYKTFFANRCIAAAKDRRRLDLAKIKPIQVEAERFKRREAVLKRDAALEKNRIKAEGDGTGKAPEEKRAENEAAFAKKTRDREAAKEKVIEKRARTERRRQKKAAEAAKRTRQPLKPSASASALAPAPASASALPTVPPAASASASAFPPSSTSAPASSSPASLPK